MASITGQMGIAVVKQTTLGTIEPTLATGSGTVDIAAGAVLGDPNAGQMESGISYSLARVGRERGYAAGSFSNLGSDYLRTDVGTLTIAFALAGNRATLGGSPADADFAHTADVGIDAILQACGLSGAAYGSGVGWVYTPTDAAACSIRIWDSGMSYGLKDVVGTLEFSMTPGEVAICTATLSGVLDTEATITFPTFDYGVQATVSAPVVENMGASWGATRGWSECTITIDNQIEDVPDSNAEGGTRSRQTGRTVTVDMTLRSDSSAGIDYEYTNLVGDGPTDNMTAATGTSAATEAATHWAIDVADLQITDDLTPDRVGGEHVNKITAVATSQTADGEFSLIFQ